MLESKLLSLKLGNRKTVPKVMIYILNSTGDSVLAFTQKYSPEAGVQVPAGTIELDENPKEAAYREFAEETGLEIEIKLELFAITYFDMYEYKDELHLRHWYIGFADNVLSKSNWDYVEQREADESDIYYKYFWHPIKQSNDLIAGHGDLLNHARSIWKNKNEK